MAVLYGHVIDVKLPTYIDYNRYVNFAMMVSLRNRIWALCIQHESASVPLCHDFAEASQLMV